MEVGFNRKKNDRPVGKWLKLRNALNICFIVMSLATVALYIFAPNQNRMAAYLCCFIAIAIKMVEVCIRMFSKKN